MAPKLTNEQREALHRSHGKPVDVEDDQASDTYVLINKDTFAHLQELQGNADASTRQHLRKLIEDGIASGDYEPADQVFADLRKFAEQLGSESRA